MSRKSAEQKLKEFLRERESISRCLRCSYYKKSESYCADLDLVVNPDYPACSEEYYYS